MFITWDGKNTISNLIIEVIAKWYSDIHLWYRWNNYIRDNWWKLIRIVTEISDNEILWFAEQTLWRDKFHRLIDWEEVDHWYSFRSTRFRLNFYYWNNGLNIAFRRINEKPHNLSDIWIDKNLHKYFLKERWLILVTWPTWSWKTTTLAAIIKFISEKRKCHIISLEDPIEYIIESKNSLIHQREVWKDTKTWEDWIKYCLRQDPDVVVVWEMRDNKTIESVIKLVDTWHLVLSTLHTINAPQTITRIINSFPPDYQNKICMQLSMVLELVLSQRLVTNKKWDWKVCAREIMINNSAIASLIRTNKITHIRWIMETKRKEWIITMEEVLARLVHKDEIKEQSALTLLEDENIYREILSHLEKWNI